VFNVELPASKVGEFDVELQRSFSIVTNNIKANMHIELKYGANNHHIMNRYLSQ